MSRRDPLLRTAGRIAEALGHGADAAAGPAPDASHDLPDLSDAARLAERLDRLRRRAVDRGEHLAAGLVGADVLRELRGVERSARAVLARGARAAAARGVAVRQGALRCLVEVFRQLADEFG